jgi:hypothetical protein
MTNIYNRFNPEKNYDSISFRADKVLQSAEFNELQSAMHHRLQNISDVLFADGDIIRDAGMVINSDTGAVSIESGALYLAGAVRGVPAANFIVPLDEIVVVGVYVQSATITELEDPALLNPAVGARGYNQPGAARNQINTQWGQYGDGTEGEFYPVYTIDHGHISAKEPPPTLDAVSQAIARYDRDSSGSNYVVTGLRVTALPDAVNGDQMYNLEEGRARVNGFGVQLNTSRRIHYAAVPVLKFIDSEPHTSTTINNQRVNLDRTPAAEIEQVRITAQRTVTINHGTYAGAADPLPDTSVIQITEVKQGATIYAKNADWILAAGKVDWSPSGAEPSPGSSFDVTYQYIKDAEITNADDTGFDVAGAVQDTLILVTYRVKLPRIDRLCLNEKGEHIWIEGISTDYNPVRPPVPSHLIELAQVIQTWTDARQIINDGVRTVAMADIDAMNQRMNLIIDLVAQQKLVSDIGTREAAAKKGVFVDPFLDDSHRDQGIAQTAASFNGVLTLPIMGESQSPSTDIQSPVLCEFNHIPVLSQNARTTGMRINPYMAFGILPSPVVLSPAIDRWTDVVDSWTSPVTRLFSEGSGNSVISTNTSTSVQLVATTTNQLQHLRQISVRFVINGFGPGEVVSAITFDGVNVVPAAPVAANPQGQAQGSFTIPANISSGSKLVNFTGSGGSYGSAVFVGQGLRESRTLQEIISTTQNMGILSVDPLAQTFSLDAPAQITGVELFVTAVGSTAITVQIRETQLGFPTQRIVAEAIMQPGAIIENQINRWLFAQPIVLMPQTEFAIVVLCNDSTSSVAVAELGKWDTAGGRNVTSQPYNVGVLLSSSNARTWSAHQDRDLTFRLLGATYTEAERVINLGNIEVEDATDLITLFPAIQPGTGADCELVITLPNGHSISASDRQIIQFPAPITGEINIVAKLRATTTLSAMLLPGSQLIVGTISNSADYVSRAIDADAAGCNVRIIFDAVIPSGASAVPKVSGTDIGDAWLNTTEAKAAKPLGNGLHEYEFVITGVNEARVRTKLELNGHSSARPKVSNLRVIVTE